MFDSKNRFVISDYQKKAPFSSFLPGIAGPLGIPVWCYYNNRGQAVCSFGVQDKDHSIMEFSSAHSAYQNVSRTGFRTFAKLDGKYCELFTGKCDMHIGMSEVEITERSDLLETSAVYFGVPGERTAALARVLTVTNISDREISIELLDGMSAIVPFGLNQDFLKNLSNLAKAWMQAEDMEKGLAYFRVRASLEDGAVVREVKGGNFCLAWDDECTQLCPVIQPSLIFGEDTSLSTAVNFERNNLDEICAATQIAANIFPCCFLPRKAVLKSGESICIRSLFGQAESKELVKSLASRINASEWFDAKRREMGALVDALCAPITSKTANPVFDAYAKQSYLDNLLRGGVPMFFRHENKSAPFYLYSRKHGDPEREYNYFSLGREYYAQGNGNFRDVNQNRRCDVLFSPELGAESIHTFFDLIQTDGYNPLVITAGTYSLRENARKQFATRLPNAADLFVGNFTPGSVAMAAEDAGMSKQEAAAFTAEVICAADSEPNANFGEGYWCDHWTYNLDLIESYLSVYPENKENLLFNEERYRWYETRVKVNPRVKRCAMTENGLRQYNALDEHCKTGTHKWMKTADGNDARSTLIEKLILLCVIKTATLDAEGMGVEMEGGRPGWYDALNGLPGLFGSSMAESCELARLIAFTADALEKCGGEISLYDEIAVLSENVSAVISTETDSYKCWDKLNTLKETYRDDTFNGYIGKRSKVSCAELASRLRTMKKAVLAGIDKAEKLNRGLIPTYFMFDVTEFEETPDGFMPKVFSAKPLPLFLEGPVRQFKLNLSEEKKQSICRAVRQSALYDEKLRMYKVNAQLAGTSFEAGRALAFTPGWLENESVWLHMEYKYLLELLKNGLYDEFAEAFHDAAVPFLAPESYGRSTLENSSFIASSANPDPSVHGRGFVARLSGSTAEFLHIWQLMFFGSAPFTLLNSELKLEFAPFIPDYLMPEDKIIESTFLGKIKIRYHANGLNALIPAVTVPISYVLIYSDGSSKTVASNALSGRDALDVREGKVTEINITMQ
ncbi:MAG: hypothetical protein IKZ30_05535 [Oscillospiraceae bacterium]|nr:hypothetical protein [Oscillospiraceae bacterium]